MGRKELRNVIRQVAAGDCRQQRVEISLLTLLTAVIIPHETDPVVVTQFFSFSTRLTLEDNF